MYTNTIPNLAVKAAAIAVLLAAAVAQAAGSSRDTGDAQARYQKEVAVCDSGQSQQDMQTCCGGQVISDSSIDFFDVDSRSKALGDILPSFECSLMLL